MSIVSKCSLKYGWTYIMVVRKLKEGEDGNASNGGGKTGEELFRSIYYVACDRPKRWGTAY